jgi:hypothetical protein
MKSFIFWDKRPCGPFKVDRRFERNITTIFSSVCYLLEADFLLGLFFDPKRRLTFS